MWIAGLSHMKLIGSLLGFLLVVSVVFGATASERRAPDTNVAVQTQTSAPASKGISRGLIADQERYAAREAASPNAKDYKGGDVIVIGATTLAVVLLVVLIVILI